MEMAFLKTLLAEPPCELLQEELLNHKFNLIDPEPRKIWRSRVEGQIRFLFEGF
jgi:hypothetical protein